MIAKIKSGAAIPIPNTKKFSMFNMKSVVVVLNANITIKEAGLQGNTIAPKKKPKIKELMKGFFFIGA